MLHLCQLDGVGRKQALYNPQPMPDNLHAFINVELILYMLFPGVLLSVVCTYAAVLRFSRCQPRKM